MVHLRRSLQIRQTDEEQGDNAHSKPNQSPPPITTIITANQTSSGRNIRHRCLSCQNPRHKRRLPNPPHLATSLRPLPSRLHRRPPPQHLQSVNLRRTSRPLIPPLNPPLRHKMDRQYTPPPPRQRNPLRSHSHPSLLPIIILHPENNNIKRRPRTLLGNKLPLNLPPPLPPLACSPRSTPRPRRPHNNHHLRQLHSGKHE